MNVLLYDMTDSDWLLCADLDGFVGQVLIVQRSIHPTWTYIYVVPSPGLLPVLANVFVPDPDFPHFPFGWTVVPD